MSWEIDIWWLVFIDSSYDFVVWIIIEYIGNNIG